MLKHELYYRRYFIIIWTIALFVCIYSMLPVYIGFIVNGSQFLSPDMLSNNSFYETIGANMKYIQSPMGVYGFLNSFFMIAGAICGIFSGFYVFNKEYLNKTADLIMTKPFKREKIFFSKLGFAIISNLIIGFGYICGSFISAKMNMHNDFILNQFLLIAFSFLLLQIFFVCFGVFAATIYPRIRTPLGFASGAAFLFYVLGAFSRKTQIFAIKLLTPFVYFDMAQIFENGSYRIEFMISYIVLIAIFLCTAFYLYRKKDVILVA